jgi:hypothetical protein
LPMRRLICPATGRLKKPSMSKADGRRELPLSLSASALLFTEPAPSAGAFPSAWARPTGTGLARRYRGKSASACLRELER